MIDSAIAFAALAHAGQKRKYTGDPYIVHPIDVMMLVRTVVPDDEEMAAASVLHDVLEDCAVSARAIRGRFGERVGDLVVGLTEVSVEGNRATRKAAEVERLVACHPDVQTIKLADIISNTGTIVQFDPNFAKTYLPEKRQLLCALKLANPTLRSQAYAVYERALKELR